MRVAEEQEQPSAGVLGKPAHCGEEILQRGLNKRGQWGSYSGPAIRVTVAGRSIG